MNSRIQKIKNWYRRSVGSTPFLQHPEFLASDNQNSLTPRPEAGSLQFFFSTVISLILPSNFSLALSPSIIFLFYMHCRWISSLSFIRSNSRWISLPLSLAGVLSPSRWISSSHTLQFVFFSRRISHTRRIFFPLPFGGFSIRLAEFLSVLPVSLPNSPFPFFYANLFAKSLAGILLEVLP